MFDRAHLAARYGLTVAEVVPVVLHPHRCAAVLLFSDVKAHSYSTSDLNTLWDYASTLGAYYSQYVNGVHLQCAACTSKNRHTGHLSQSAEAANDVSDSTISTMTADPKHAQDNPSLQEACPMEELVRRASETSAVFFGEVGFLEGHLLSQM